MQYKLQSSSAFCLFVLQATKAGRGGLGTRLGWGRENEATPA